MLLNAMTVRHGTFTSPEVVKTVVSMCKDAGAKEIRFLDCLGPSRWRQNKLLQAAEGSGAIVSFFDTNNPSHWKEIDIPRGKALKRVRLVKSLFESDVLIVLPIFKHHVICRYTGSMKIYMAVTHSSDCRKFHRDNNAHLDQSIADLNTVARPADLVVVDAMELITENGPGGPGNIIAPHKVITGKNRVTVDAYCAPILKMKPQECKQISAAYGHGLGEINLSNLSIKEIEVN
jgi:uncharacterized protein (DUF362 family)